MKNNLGQVDRSIRLALGALGLSLVLLDTLHDTLLVDMVLVVSIVLLASAVFGFCPLYKFLGFKSVKSKKVTY